MSDSLLYAEADRAAVAAERRKRLAVTLVPSCLLILLAAAVFVWFRLRHDVSGWVWSALLTVVGGAYALFFGGTYLRPVSLYLKHIGYMLDGQRREAVGVERGGSGDRDERVVQRDGLGLGLDADQQLRGEQQAQPLLAPVAELLPLVEDG